MARALEYLKDHFDLDNIDYLIEELDDKPDFNIDIEYDGLLIECKILFPDEERTKE